MVLGEFGGRKRWIQRGTDLTQDNMNRVGSGHGTERRTDLGWMGERRVADILRVQVP